MADLMRTSVKQIKMMLGCARQWAGHYIFKLPAIEGEALAVGNRVHAQCSALLTGKRAPFGAETEVGKMARALVSELPAPQGPVVSEIVKIVKLPQYELEIDLRCDYLSRPLFVDFKTTGAPSRSAKLQNGKLWALGDLTNDVQANVYAFLLMHDHWAIRSVQARWAFVSKKFKPGQTPKTWSVDHTFEYETCREWFETYVVPAARMMKEMRAAGLTELQQVPHNPAACEFTGHFCDIAGHCGMRSSPVMAHSELHLPVLPP